jgi:MscS family membrane protein
MPLKLHSGLGIKNLIYLIDNNLNASLVKSFMLFGVTPGRIIVAFLLLLLIIISNYYLKNPISKFIKWVLFKNRKVILNRYLFYRVDKILRPFRVLIGFFLFYKALNIFLVSEILDNIYFLINSIILAWAFYEIFKFFLYIWLMQKIKRHQGARRELFSLFLNITKLFLTIAVLLLIMSHLGIDVTALITSLGIGGIIVGLSAKDTLTNFFDSIRLVSEDAFRQGDWIETKEVDGIVTEIGLVATKIRTFDNALVTVPNSILANNFVRNWTKRVIGRRIKFNIPIKITSNLKELDRVTYEIYEMLHSHPDIMTLNKLRYIKRFKKTYEDNLFNLEDLMGVRRTLLVYFDDIKGYYLNLLIYAFSISVDWEEWLRVKQDIIKKIIKIIDESQLEFAVAKEEIKIITDSD